MLSDGRRCRLSCVAGVCLSRPPRERTPGTPVRADVVSSSRPPLSQAARVKGLGYTRCIWATRCVEGGYGPRAQRDLGEGMTRPRATFRLKATDAMDLSCTITIIRLVHQSQGRRRNGLERRVTKDGGMVTARLSSVKASSTMALCVLSWVWLPRLDKSIFAFWSRRGAHLSEP